MANQTLTADILTQSIADGVAERLGLSSEKVVEGMSALVDIKKLLGTMIDPNKTVQTDQKFPFVFSKTFKDVLSTLKEDKKESAVSESEKKEKPKSLLDIISKHFKSAITTFKEDKKETFVDSKVEKKEKPKPVVEPKVEKKEKPKPVVEPKVEKKEKPKPVVEPKVEKKEKPKPVVEPKVEKKEEPKPVVEPKVEKKEEPKSLLDIVLKQFKSAITTFKENKKEAFVSKLEKKEPPKSILDVVLDRFKNVLTLDGGKSVSKLEKKEEPKPILFAGFTLQGLREMQKVIKGDFADLVKKFAKNEKKEAGGNGLLSLLGPGLAGLLKGALMAGGGIALLLGGLAALITGLQTDGPFKGLLKIFSKAGLTGGLKLLEKGASIFLKNMKSLIDAPVKLLKVAYRGLRGIFGKGVAKTITTTIGKSAGLFTKMASGLLKVLSPLLRRLPLIGTVISLGFAYTRFKKGDVVGGIIDVLSGIANAFAIVPGYGLIGSGIAVGLDVLNAILDHKAGGATGNQTRAKLDILKGMGEWIAEKIIKLPMIGPLIKAVKHLANREWKKGLKQLAYAIPVVDAIAAFLGDEEASDTAKGVAGAVKSVNWSEIGSWLFSTFKNVPIIGPLMKAIEHFRSSEYLKGLKQLAYIVPAFEIIGSLLGDSETGAVSAAIGDWGKDLVTDLMTWIKETIWDKVTGFIGNIVDGAKKHIGNYIDNLSWDPRSWVSMTPQKDEKQSASSQQPSPTVTSVGDAVIDEDGGMVVGTPTEGAMFQLSKNDGIVAAPFGSSADSTRSSDKTIENILGVIASNTGATNGNLTNLIAGFNNLAKELAKTGAVDKAPVVISNNTDDSNSSGFAGIAQYIQTATSSARSYTGYASSMKPYAV